MVNMYQKHMDPVRAAILYALEPVWATLLAITMDMTEFSFWLIVGGSALLIGNLISELGNQSVSEQRFDTSAQFTTLKNAEM